MSQYWSKVVHSLTPYVPGEQPKLNDMIKLNTNENPYPPSPKVLAAIQQAASGDLRLYPDPNADQLKRAIADFHQLDVTQVFVGNSSDEVLALTFLALLKHELPILFPDITYSFYPVYCGLYEIASRQIPLDVDFRLKVDDYLVPNGGIIFPNPNAPTGRLLALDEIERLLISTSDSVLVVDEAYIDFGGVSAIPLIHKYPNLLIIQTLSKARSLAGLRVGLAVGHSDLISALERVKNSFNSYPLDRLAIAGATAAFADVTYFNQTCAAVVATRAELISNLEKMGFDIVPSSANFIFVRHPQVDARKLQAYLRSKAIIVRHFSQTRIDQYLRITIGTDEQCQQLAQTLDEYLRPSQ